MQALALLHQTMREHEWSSRLMLNGGTTRLGTVADVIGQYSHACEIGLLEDDGSWFDWKFRGERDEMSMRVERTSGETTIGDGWRMDESISSPLHYLLPDSVEHSLIRRLRGLTYLTAERLGPRELYLFDDPQLTPVVGPRGEYAVSVLHSNRDIHVAKQLEKEDIPPTFFRQVEAWMAFFFPGCILEVDQMKRTNALTLGIRVSKETDFLRPIHTGFGLTQVLPIIVASLSASTNDLLLIENPEVHLHPAAQGKMGRFLALVASTGVQVMIETHSDHVLNGIRRAVKDDVLNHESVALHFFRHGTETIWPQVESPALSANGNIDSWPDGFFDQFDHDMSALAGWI